MTTAATKARVLIFGTGSVGTIAAHALETGRQAAVTVICRSNYTAVSKNGFTIDSIEHGRNIKSFYPSTIRNTIPNLLQEKNLQPFDYLVITTKNTPDIPPSLPDLISPAVTRGKTSILLLQNGLNIEKPFLKRFPHNTILSGVSLIGATETAPGVVRHDGRDKAYIGVFPSALPSSESELKARKFVQMYNASGAVTWEYDPDVLKWRWKKLVYNAAFSSIAALTGLDTGAMRMSRFVVEDLVRPAMLEIVAVAKAAGVSLPEDIHDVFIRIDPAEKRYLPSMGVDVKKGNFIELENIIGEPVREAERLGVPAPTLRTLYSLLRGIQLRTKEAKGMWEAKFDDDNPYR